MAVCGPCSQLLADAGAARLGWRCCASLRRSLRPRCWSAFWRKPAGPQAMPRPAIAARGHRRAAVPVPIAGDVAAMAPGIAYGNVVPFPRRCGGHAPELHSARSHAAAAPCHDRRDGVLLHRAHHEPDRRSPAGPARERLSPSSLKRDFYSANTRVVQYYEGLRVVYELESRVHDLQSARTTTRPPAARAQPASAANPQASRRPRSPIGRRAQPGRPPPQPGSNGSLPQAGLLRVPAPAAAKSLPQPPPAGRGRNAGRPLGRQDQPAREERKLV
jgi:hypothetical protein